MQAANPGPKDTGAHLHEAQLIGTASRCATTPEGRHTTLKREGEALCRSWLHCGGLYTRKAHKPRKCWALPPQEALTNRLSKLLHRLSGPVTLACLWWGTLWHRLKVFYKCACGGIHGFIVFWVHISARDGTRSLQLTSSVPVVENYIPAFGVSVPAPMALHQPSTTVDEYIVPARACSCSARHSSSCCRETLLLCHPH